MRIVCLIQARMSSQRLPGKVLREVLGEPLLRYLVDRVICCKEIDMLALATSTDQSDDILVDFAETINLAYHRGPLKNVAQRMLDAAKFFQADAFVRISGDSPLIDSSLVDRLVTIFRQNPEVDLVTNVQARTFPKGQSVEVVPVSTLNHLVDMGLTEDESEHVTKAIYNATKDFRIVNVVHDHLLGDMQLSVDTEHDINRFQLILEALGEPYSQHSLEQITSVASRLP